MRQQGIAKARQFSLNFPPASADAPVPIVLTGPPNPTEVKILIVPHDLQANGHALADR